MEIDRRRVVHHVGVVLAGEDIARAAHVGRQLVHLIEVAIDDLAAKALLAQVAQHEFVRGGGRKFRQLQVYATDKVAFAFQPAREMRADEPAGAKYESSTHARHGSDPNVKRKCAPWVVGSPAGGDRKSTRLNSSHLVISYAVFC